MAFNADWLPVKTVTELHSEAETGVERCTS